MGKKRKRAPRGKTNNAKLPKIVPKSSPSKKVRKEVNQKTTDKIKNANSKWKKFLEEPSQDRPQHKAKKKRSNRTGFQWGKTQVQEYASIHDPSIIVDSEPTHYRRGGPYLTMDWKPTASWVEDDVGTYGEPERGSNDAYSKTSPKHRAEIIMQHNPENPHPFVPQDYYKEQGLAIPDGAYTNLSDLKNIKSARLMNEKYKGKDLYLLTLHDGQMVLVLENWSYEHVLTLRSFDLAYCREKGIVFHQSHLVEFSESWCPDNEPNKLVSQAHFEYMMDKCPGYQLSSLAYEKLHPRIIESVVLEAWQEEVWKMTPVDGFKTWDLVTPEKPLKLAIVRAHDGRVVRLNKNWELEKLKWMDVNHCRKEQTQVPGFTLTDEKENVDRVIDTKIEETNETLVSDVYYNGKQGRDWPDLTGRDLLDLTSITAVKLFSEDGHKLVRLWFHGNFNVVVKNEWAAKKLNCWINQDYYRRHNMTLKGIALAEDFNAVAWHRMQYFKFRGKVLCKMLTKRGNKSQWIFVDKKYAEDNWSVKKTFIRDLRKSLQTGKPVTVQLGEKAPSPPSPSPTGTSSEPNCLPADGSEALSQASAVSHGSRNTMQFNEVCVQEDNKANCMAVAFYLMCAFAERRDPQRWPGLGALGKEVFDCWKEDDTDGEMLKKISAKAAQYGYKLVTGKANSESKPLSGKFDILDPNAAAHGYPFMCTHRQQDGMEQPHVVSHYDQYVLDGKDFSEPVRCTQASLNASVRGVFHSIARYWYISHFQGNSVWFNGKFEPPPSIKRNHNEITSVGGDFLGRIKAPKKRSNDNINGGGSNLLDTIEPLSKRSRYVLKTSPTKSTIMLAADRREL